MNKKLLAITFATILMGQSARGGCTDTLKELFINWPLALMPETVSDDLAPAVLRDGGKLFKCAPNVTYNSAEKIYEVKDQQDKITKISPANGQYMHDQSGMCFMLNNNALVEADRADISNATAKQFVDKKAFKVTREEKIDILDKQAQTAAQGFRVWKLKYFEKRWVAISLFAIIGSVAVIGKKGYDLYQRRAAQQAAVDFDEFENDEDEQIATEIPAQSLREAEKIA